MTTATAAVMDVNEVKAVLEGVKGATESTVIEDGTRIHVRYERIAGANVTDRAKSEAQRAAGLGLPMDAYTGRVTRVWTNASGDTMLTMLVELERDHKYRAFNVDQGSIKNIVVLGD